MTANRKQEANPRAVLVNPSKLYNNLEGSWWLPDVHLTAQSNSHWTRLLLTDSHYFGSQTAIPAIPYSQHCTGASPQLPAPQP